MSILCFDHSKASYSMRNVPVKEHVLKNRLKSTITTTDLLSTSRTLLFLCEYWLNNDFIFPEYLDIIVNNYYKLWPHIKYVAFCHLAGI